VAITKEKTKIIEETTNLFSKVSYKILYSNQKGGEFLLGLDLLKDNAKKDLLYITLAKLENLFQSLVVKDNCTTKFLQKNGESIFIKLLSEICEDFLYQQYGRKFRINSRTLKNTIYTKQLLTDLEIIFQVPFSVLVNPKNSKFRSVYYPVYTSASKQFIEALLDNLVIEVSNCLVFFIVVNFSYIYLFRQRIFRSKFLSLRNIERFKNNFIWQIRFKKQVLKPANIYENCYRIYILRTTGITMRLIYANRTAQIKSMQNSSLFIIAFIELRDFLNSRLDEITYVLSSGLRFILTSVLGRFVGLIWRGVIDGLKNNN
jgi:hypothetical protein